MINNVIVNCAGGVNTASPWDAQIESCIFKGCTTAVKVSGSLSRTVSDNDFFGNGTNFVGYPTSYGNPIILNRNGTPCDVLLNIFQDPQFVLATDFHLQATSPCIDAGEGSAANFDNSFPPSLGTVTNDIGAYGGPNAGQWIMPGVHQLLHAFGVKIHRGHLISRRPPVITSWIMPRLWLAPTTGFKLRTWICPRRSSTPNRHLHPPGSIVRRNFIDCHQVNPALHHRFGAIAFSSNFG